MLAGFPRRWVGIQAGFECSIQAKAPAPKKMMHKPIGFSSKKGYIK
jgi:hypothetical protein